MRFPLSTFRKENGRFGRALCASLWSVSGRFMETKMSMPFFHLFPPPQFLTYVGDKRETAWKNFCPYADFGAIFFFPSSHCVWLWRVPFSLSPMGELELKTRLYDSRWSNVQNFARALCHSPPIILVRLAWYLGFDFDFLWGRISESLILTALMDALENEGT